MSHAKDKYLEIYLNDHCAGAVAGVRLAKRLARQNSGSRWADDLRELAEEIETDARILARLRKDLKISGGEIKRLIALLGMRVSSLKPNGQLRGYSPLSRLLEAEALQSGVISKQRLWAALADASRSDLEAYDFEELDRRAKRQQELLRDFHHDAARTALSYTSEPAPEERF
mgnify:CR=1 FL=1